MLPDTRTAGQPIWGKCFKAMLGECDDNDNEDKTINDQRLTVNDKTAYDCTVNVERGTNVDFLK